MHKHEAVDFTTHLGCRVRVKTLPAHMGDGVMTEFSVPSNGQRAEIVLRTPEARRLARGLYPADAARVDVLEEKRDRAIRELSAMVGHPIIRHVIDILSDEGERAP